MNVQTSFPLVDKILEPWKNTISVDYNGYRNHVYRVLNFCYELKNCSPEEKEKLEIAAAFHDIGVLSDNTFAYLEPSIIRANEWLFKNNLTDWRKELGLIIRYHHKISHYKNPEFPLVELFRKADLVDASLGKRSFSVSKEFYHKTVAEIPITDFFKSLIKKMSFSDIMNIIFKVFKR